MALLEFYGKECPHCKKMMPLVDKLIEEGFEIEKKEVWHDEENAEEMKKHDDGKCGGVPFFINTDSGQYICGEASEERLRKWAEGEELE